MKKKSLIIICIGLSLFTLLTSVGFAFPPPIRSPHEVMERWTRSQAEFDIDAFLSCYWEDAVRIEVQPEGFRHFHRGHDQIAEAQAALFRLMRREPRRMPDRREDKARWPRARLSSAAGDRASAFASS